MVADFCHREQVNTGLVDGNPASTDGMVNVMQHAQKLVPKRGEDIIELMTCGDGATVIGMTRARKALANGQYTGTGYCRFRGLVEAPQEFHKLGLLLQDMMNQLFCGSKLADRGTLANLKERFNHRSVKKKVMANYQHVWDFIQFATVSYVVILALHLYGMDNIEQTPSSYPVNGTVERKLGWLENAANEIVQFCWMPFSAQDVQEVNHAYYNDGQGDENNDTCICFGEKDDELVTCGNADCGYRFHLSCIPDFQAKDRWFCSVDCAKAGTCWCCGEGKGDVTECSAGIQCTGKRIYHTACINDFTQQGKWFCSEACSLGLQSLEDDQVLQYSRTLMWQGLNALVRHDAVRQGDGPAIVSHWKFDMLSFWNYKHPIYLRIGHQFLANVSGFLPKRLRTDLVWNRLANLSGRPGANIPLDLVNEFLNNDFKEMLKRSHGMYTDKQVNRCAEMSGAYGKEINKIISATSLHNELHPSKARKTTVPPKDVVRFTNLYLDDALVGYVPGRSHEGIATLEKCEPLRKPHVMGKELRSLGHDMDRWKEIFAIPDQTD